MKAISNLGVRNGFLKLIGENMEEIKRINVEQAQKMLQVTQVTIVDARDPASYHSSHIENAIMVSDENIEGFLENTAKDKPLICYCYHGFSSQNLAAFFLQNGFKDVYSIDGGFEAWERASL